MSCYGCDGTGKSVWARNYGQPCLCRYCSECGEVAPQPLETLDIKENGSGYSPCAECLNGKKADAGTEKACSPQ